MVRYLLVLLLFNIIDSINLVFVLLSHYVLSSLLVVSYFLPQEKKSGKSCKISNVLLVAITMQIQRVSLYISHRQNRNPNSKEPMAMYISHRQNVWSLKFEQMHLHFQLFTRANKWHIHWRGWWCVHNYCWIYTLHMIRQMPHLIKVI